MGSRSRLWRWHHQLISRGLHIRMLALRVGVSRRRLDIHDFSSSPSITHWTSLHGAHSHCSSCGCDDDVLASPGILSDPDAFNPPRRQLALEIGPSLISMSGHPLSSKFSQYLFAEFDKGSTPCMPGESLIWHFAIMASGKSGQQEAGVHEDPLHYWMRCLYLAPQSALQSQFETPYMSNDILGTFFYLPVALGVIGGGLTGIVWPSRVSTTLD